MDDTFYLFTLSNTIPYLPIVVYHDAAGTIPWSDPIEMLANGTVPIDVYWDDATVYRLEWRAGPTQADELVYLVENYMPGEGSGGNVTNSANNTTNQITNPQFSLVNFTGAHTVTASSLVNIAPGWDIVTTGSGPGSITVTQLEVDGVSGDTSNPSYALQIASTGWDTVGIKQTFEQNGALWSSGQNESDISGVALSISAYSSAGTSPPLEGFITYAGSSTVDTTIFSVAQINGAPSQYGGAGALPASVNTANPDTATTSVTFSWTSNNTVVVTSVQLIGQQGDDIAQVDYQEESLERQVDHTFHYYADSLITEPKETLLTGWNFPLNPWQFTTTSLTNVAANQYTADQTIVAQQTYVASASGNNVAVGQAAAADNYGFKVTAVTATNQFALIQYIDPTTIAPYWGGTLSSLLKMRYQNNHASTGVKVKMRLIYNASLPSATSQTYPIASWTALGEPVYAAGWTAITPLNDPEYDVSLLSTFTSLPFEGMTLPADSATTMTLGIVVYTTKSMNSTATADFMVFEDCSLSANQFATASNVMTTDEVLRRCEFYYEKSYGYGQLPGNAGAGNSLSAQQLGAAGGSGSALYPTIFGFEFNTIKRTETPVVTIYSTAGTAANVSAYVQNTTSLSGYVDATIAGHWSVTTSGDRSTNYAFISNSVLATCAGSTLIRAWILYHYTVDARLGV